MNSFLITAAALAIGIGFAHSWLGEKYIIIRLLSRTNLPVLFGSDEFTKQTIRFAWHLTTVAWCGLAAILVVLSGAVVGFSVADGLLMSVAATFVFSAVLALVFTRGRHLSWVVFLAIAIICALVAL